MPGSMANPNPNPNPHITLNLPSHLTPKSNTTTTTTQPSTKSPPPPTTFLTGTWHVTHSTLPLWKTKRNVTITYTPLPSKAAAAAAAIPRLDDLVAYQSGDPSKARSKRKAKAKIHTVHGTDTASEPGVWHWRGKGWLAVASSRWEVLGFGADTTRSAESSTGETDTATDTEANNAWVVTYFAKTLFTPAGIDVYSRARGGVSGEVLERIWEALRRLGEAGEGEEIGRLVEGVFEVPRD